MNALTVPGRHEARALTVRCPLCASLTRPAVVLDCPDYRQAGYGCGCGHRWVKTHRPAGQQPSLRGDSFSEVAQSIDESNLIALDLLESAKEKVDILRQRLDFTRQRVEVLRDRQDVTREGIDLLVQRVKSLPVNVVHESSPCSECGAPSVGETSRGVRETGRPAEGRCS